MRQQMHHISYNKCSLTQLIRNTIPATMMRAALFDACSVSAMAAFPLPTVCTIKAIKSIARKKCESGTSDMRDVEVKSATQVESNKANSSIRLTCGSRYPAVLLSDQENKMDEGHEQCCGRRSRQVNIRAHRRPLRLRVGSLANLPGVRKLGARTAHNVLWVSSLGR